VTSRKVSLALDQQNTDQSNPRSLGVNSPFLVKKYLNTVERQYLLAEAMVWPLGSGLITLEILVTVNEGLAARFASSVLSLWIGVVPSSEGTEK